MVFEVMRIETDMWQSQIEMNMIPLELSNGLIQINILELN